MCDLFLPTNFSVCLLCDGKSLCGCFLTRTPSFYAARGYNSQKTWRGRAFCFLCTQAIFLSIFFPFVLIVLVNNYFDHSWTYIWAHIPTGASGYQAPWNPAQVAQGFKLRLAVRGHVLHGVGVPGHALVGGVALQQGPLEGKQQIVNTLKL